MHELSVCLGLLQQLEQIAREQNAAAVEKIYLQVGPLSGVEPDLLMNAWPLAAAGSVADDAELVIAATDVVVTCTACGEESAARPNRLLCAACGDFRTRVVRGDEMILERLELRLTTARTGKDPSAMGQQGTDPVPV